MNLGEYKSSVITILYCYQYIVILTVCLFSIKV